LNFTAGNYRQGLWNRERDDITGKVIIPALNRQKSRGATGPSARYSFWPP